MEGSVYVAALCIWNLLDKLGQPLQTGDYLTEGDDQIILKGQYFEDTMRAYGIRRDTLLQPLEGSASKHGKTCSEDEVKCSASWHCENL